MRKGLTIGELLVTMAIIGVIAALVIPGFLKDYHKKLYTTKLHKSYEMLFSAIETACNDNNVSSLQQTPYGGAGNAAQQAEFSNKYFKTIEPAKQSPSGVKPYFGTYRPLSNTSAAPTQMTIPLNSATAKLKSGEIIDIGCQTATECIVSIDINGTDEPNIGGRDMFWFRIDKQNNQVMSHSNPDSCAAYDGSKWVPKSDIRGEGCLNRIIKSGWVMEY